MDQLHEPTLRWYRSLPCTGVLLLSRDQHDMREAHDGSKRCIALARVQAVWTCRESQPHIIGLHKRTRLLIVVTLGYPPLCLTTTLT